MTDQPPIPDGILIETDEDGNEAVQMDAATLAAWLNREAGKPIYDATQVAQLEDWKTAVTEVTTKPTIPPTP